MNYSSATILRISTVFSATSCECERNISTLQLLKTYLRSTMGQGRLTSLGLMYIHGDVPVNTQKDSCRFCNEATEKDYSSRHFNRVINLDTCSICILCNKISNIYNIYLYVSNSCILVILIL